MQILVLIYDYTKRSARVLKENEHRSQEISDDTSLKIAAAAAEVDSYVDELVLEKIGKDGAQEENPQCFACIQVIHEKQHIAPPKVAQLALENSVLSILN